MSNAFSSTVSPPAGLFGIFTNRRINTKIMIGFAAVLTLLAVLSVLSYRGFLKVAEGFDAFNQRVKVVGIVRDVDYGFIGYRRFVREFSVSGDETLIAEARKRQEALAKSVKQGLDEIKNPERRAGMAEINEQFVLYARNFDKLVALKQEQNKLTKEVLDPLGSKTLTMIEELQAIAFSLLRAVERRRGLVLGLVVGDELLVRVVRQIVDPLLCARNAEREILLPRERKLIEGEGGVERNLALQAGLRVLRDELHAGAARIEHEDRVGLGRARLRQLGREVELVGPRGQFRPTISPLKVDATPSSISLPAA